MSEDYELLKAANEETLALDKPNAIIAYIGTGNPIKRDAAEKAFQKFFPKAIVTVKMHSVDPEIPYQPIGLDMVQKGAFLRAKKVLEVLKQDRKELVKIIDEDQKKWIIGIGIEAGLVETPFVNSGYMDFQYVVMLDLSGKKTIGAGPGWEYPPKVTQQVIKGKGDVEIGKIVGDLAENQNIKYEKGAIGFFSKGVLTREKITSTAIEMAIIPRISEEHYSL